MKRYVILSADNNPDYLYYLPLTCWAWRKFGWTPFVIAPQPNGDLVEYVLGKSCDLKHWAPLPSIDGLRSDTVAQVSRLYAAYWFLGSAYLMTGDADMIPLSDYWQPLDGDMTVWGWDLTSNQHIPICYIGMRARDWKKVMDMDDIMAWMNLIERDAKKFPVSHKDADPVARWCYDQELITTRMAHKNFRVINRGVYTNGYPIGRVDRSAWHLNHSSFIDAHLPRGMWRDQAVLDQVTELLRKIWPDESFTWLNHYTNEFKSRLS